MVIALVFIILVFAVCRREQGCLKAGGEGRVLWPRVLLWILAAAWVCVVVYYGFLIRQAGYHGGVNTQPFWEIKRAFRLLGPTIFDGIRIASRTVFMDLILNILLFVPFGMMLPLLCSALIEGVQYLTQLGMTDVDDLINNTLGTLIGLLLFLLFIRPAGRKNIDI